MAVLVIPHAYTIHTGGVFLQATHRFCADCKHNVVTALDILTGKYGVDEVCRLSHWRPSFSLL